LAFYAEHDTINTNQKVTTKNKCGMML